MKSSYRMIEFTNAAEQQLDAAFWQQGFSCSQLHFDRLGVFSY